MYVCVCVQVSMPTYLSQAMWILVTLCNVNFIKKRKGKRERKRKEREKGTNTETCS